MKVPAEAAGQRLDVFLTSEPSLHNDTHFFSRSKVQELIDEGRVTVNGAKPGKSLKLQGGELISIDLPTPVSGDDIPPEDLPIRVVFEDKYLVVVDKPAGIATHATSQMRTGTLINALKGLGVELPSLYAPYRPGIVHRIDKRTSGLLVVAKREEPYLKLVEMMKGREISRLYRALVIGNLPSREGKFEGEIGRHPTNRKKMAVVERGGKPAVTLYKVIERYPGVDFAGMKLLSGRTHQIRVHLSNGGRYIFGDTTYGDKNVTKVINDKLERVGVTPKEKEAWKVAVMKLEDIRRDAPGHMLHAAELSFKHPITGEDLRFEAELPEYFMNALTILREMGSLPDGF